MARPSTRNASMMADYIVGISAETLAEREKISTARVYQILSEGLLRLGYRKLELARQKPQLALDRLRASLRPSIYVHKAQTLEEMFYEILGEQRSITS